MSHQLADVANLLLDAASSALGADQYEGSDLLPDRVGLVGGPGAAWDCEQLVAWFGPLDTLSPRGSAGEPATQPIGVLVPVVTITLQLVYCYPTATPTGPPPIADLHAATERMAVGALTLWQGVTAALLDGLLGDHDAILRSMSTDGPDGGYHAVEWPVAVTLALSED